MSWEAWIDRNELVFSNYDDLFDYLVTRYDVNIKSRKVEIVDKRQFLARWAMNLKNNKMFKRYTNNNSIGRRLGLKDHSCVTYLVNHRTQSYEYKENTKELVEVLSKQYICI